MIMAITRTTIIMTTPKTKYRFTPLLKTGIMLAAVGIISILFSVITEKSICLFYNLTGVPCPACGMTRAFRRLFAGDVAMAFYAHPLFPLILALPIIAFISPENYKSATFLYIVLTAVFILTWIVRLIMFFPNEPMAFLESSVIGKLLR